MQLFHFYIVVIIYCGFRQSRFYLIIILYLQSYAACSYADNFVKVK
jgi:hypothetical protein